ncbi:MAG: DUF1858 domain-containing protein [Firmicutes bacterium]|nr:DUF1858 domain-containing protein [Bacillota bacterium]
MEKITKTTTIQEVIEMGDKAVEVLLSFGRRCVGCPKARTETVELVSQKYGIELEEFLAKLNEAVS